MPYRLRKVNRKGEKFGAKAAARLKKPAACSIIILFIGKKGVREMKKRTISVLTAVIMLCCALVPVYSVHAAYPSSDDVMSVAEGIIEWKKRSMGLSGSDNLLSPAYVSAAGSPAGDWYPIGLGRLGIADDYARYLAAIRENISERYAKRGGLDAVKSTEWHRISLAVLALGGDPTSFGFDADGKPVNLIADGVYNRKTLGAQGINGLIWGLIALDAADASVPDGAYYTRDGIIAELLSLRCPDGGFAFSGDRSDPDITAMAITALAPYYGSEKAYKVTFSGKETVTTVREAVDGALLRLSGMQLETGDYRSWGIRNSGSVCQVIVALCSLGIDPFSDVRFIKNGVTLWDGLMIYKNSDGGFIGNLSDGNMPSGSMAGEQALYAMAAIIRQRSGAGRLFDFSDVRKTPVTFTENDMATAEKVTTEIKTENFSEVLRLIYILDFCPEFEGKSEYAERLAAAKAEILRIKAEVDDINSAIKNISRNTDRKSLDEIARRYNALSDYDRAQIENYDDVLRAYARIKTSERTTVIAVATVFAIFAISVVTVASAKRRRKLRLPDDETEDDE